MGRKAAAIFLLACGLWAAPGALAATARTPEKDLEYGLKAAFLFNFAKFVDWPPAAFEPAAPFTLCVFGDDPFGAVLDSTVAGEAVAGRPIAVRRGTRIADLKGCHILFVSRAERGRLPEVLAAVRGGNALTVGESDGFLADGGMIRFYLEANKVRFAVNLAAVERSPLKISSKLLRLARVSPEPEGTPR